MKAVLVGTYQVGKTSLVSAYFDNPFEYYQPTTVAPASCTATFNLPDDVTVNMQIWDTAGQERFQSISMMFYRESDVAFVCWDFNKNQNLEKWINQVKGEAPECKIILVITKSDLLSKEQLEEIEKEKSNIIKQYEAENLFVTSSLKNKNVKELFEYASKFAGDDVASEDDIMEKALEPSFISQTLSCC